MHIEIESRMQREVDKKKSNMHDVGDVNVSSVRYKSKL